jgi:quercetin dioxygenase-like cupin family protein
MMRISDTATTGNRRVHPGWWALAVSVVVAAVAIGQVSPLQIIPLAEGSNPDHNVILHVKGPTDVLQTDLIFQPGGTTGWHTHPGPVVVVIKSGALTEIESDGCMVVHPAGSAFFEDPNVVHNVVNHTGVVTEVYATFLSPSGAQPLIPASDPGRTCHKNGH